MDKVGSYTIQEKIHEKRNSIVYRGKKAHNQETVIIKVLKTRYHTPSMIARFRQEYHLVKNLAIDGIVKTRELVEKPNLLAIIKEDFYGVSLKEFIESRPLGLMLFLKIGSQIAEILGNLHQSNIIHKDIKPANILINPEDNVVKITDFDISTVFTPVDEELYNPDIILGTLAYMSPEQTGRMNRLMDYRTDLYSLGITFYELLTGTVPFKAADPMELIHAHLARKPVPPHELHPEIPPVISEIILKLLAKTPEDRYQNCFGLKADLDECINRFNSKGIIKTFTLAAGDIPLQFHIPQIIVGREKEVQVLTEFFRQASAGSSEFLLVQGEPGIGKSALINEIHKPIVAQKGYFVSGKYERLKKDIPYCAIIRAFQGLLQQILAESEERIGIWKNKILSLLGSNGKIMIGVLPELEYIIGAQPDVPELDPEESRNRFELLFQSFISVFTTADHPLVLFLDDLQWADLASLNLIKAIIINRDTRCLLLIGAYRDNEVNQHHPLSITLEEIRNAGKQPGQLVLGSLNVEHVNQMVVQALMCRPEVSLSLAVLIQKKTGGNPFFTNQFLRNLHDTHALEFDPRTGWKWDMAKIEAMHFTENVVEFMAQKIASGAARTRNILKICACLGNQFDLDLLSLIAEESIDEILAGLTAATQEGFLILHGDAYRFQHDRIQEAAYSLLPEKEKAGWHYKIGNVMLGKTAPPDLDAKIFYIADQLNRGSSLVNSYEERFRLMNINLQAAMRAKKTAAFAIAADYFVIAQSLLSSEEWKAHPQIFFELSLRYTESLFLSGNMGEAKVLCDRLFGMASGHLDKASIYVLKAKIIDVMGEKREKVLAEIRKGLELCGITLADDYGEIERGIGEGIGKMQGYFAGHAIEELAALPEMKDPDKIMAMNLLLRAIPAAIQSYPPLFFLIALTMFDLAVTYGTTAVSSKNFVDCGIIQGSMLGDYEAAYRLGKAAFALIDKYQADALKPAVCFVFSLYISAWRVHYRESLDYFNLARQTGLETGNIEYTTHSLAQQIIRFVYTGRNLEECRQLINNALTYMEETHSFVSLSVAKTLNPIHKLLIGSDPLEEADLLEEFKASNNVFCLCTFGQLNTMVYSLLDDRENTEKWNTFTEQYLQGGVGHFQMADHYLYQSLLFAGKWKTAPAEERKSIMELLLKNRERLKQWSENCPANFAHKYHLLAAEIAAIKEEPLDVIIGLYKEAGEAIGKEDFIHMQALVNEREGKFWLEKGQAHIGKLFIREAYALYKQWGAAAKVKNLEKKYAVLVFDVSGKTDEYSPVNDLVMEDTSSLEAQSLDLTTVIKASQSLSGEIDLEKLLMRFLQLSIENAGAEQGYLIIENKNDKKLYIEAAGKTNSRAVIEKTELSESNSLLACSVVNYVHKTGMSLVLDDASEDDRFANDPYIAGTRPKSILCTPMKHKGAMAGILYLENNLVTHAFTSARVELMQILTTQTAISIENSQLIVHREKVVEFETEMQLAKRIQTALIPRKPEIPGFEISSYMHPADIVGGDYYDVINTPAGDWIIIGDASGHGIPAGLVMTMTQTAIHTTLLQNREIEPSELIVKVNGIITKNIRLLGGAKYMTLLALRVQHEGEFTFAGAHLDILVYRAEECRVERITTKGIWIGILDDIVSLIEDNSFMLAPGDTLLLYTDGITECQLKGETNRTQGRNQMFGIDNLTAVFGRFGKLPTAEILDGILEEVRLHYLADDDISLMVIKRVT